MKGIVHNWSLVLPILMLLLWIFMQIVRDRNFARSFEQLDCGKDDSSRHILSSIAAKSIYETETKISKWKYFNATWKMNLLRAKAVAVLLLLDTMQHDDGTNYVGQQLDILAGDSSAAFTHGLLGALVFNFVFYKAMRRWFDKEHSRNQVIMAMVSMFAIGCLLSGAAFSTFQSLQPDPSEYYSPITRPDDYWVSYLLPGASAIWFAYALEIVPHKIAIVPTIVLIGLSSLSYALPLMIYCSMRLLLRFNRARAMLADSVSYGRNYQYAENRAKHRLFSALIWLQNAYWPYVFLTVMWTYLTV